MSEIWIVFKSATADARGWENRKLLPSGVLTDILWENWDYSGVLPQVGDRVRAYAQLEDNDSGAVTHGKDGDWVVTRVQQFSSFDTEQRIVLCYCEHQPIDSKWEKLNRGAPVAEMLEAIEV